MKASFKTRLLILAGCVLLVVYLSAMAWGLYHNTTLFFSIEEHISRLTGYDEVEILLNSGSMYISGLRTTCFASHR